MNHRHARARMSFPWSSPASPVVLMLAALIASASAAQEDDGPGEAMHRPSAGPTTDAPSGNPLYRIADHADLGTRVMLQILWRKAIGGQLVNVVNGGDAVILTGQVRSDTERQLAERIAMRTSGVGRVDNRLQVDPRAVELEEALASTATTPSDAWISTRVAGSLKFDREVDAGRIHVGTEDGVVTLSGSVPTAAQRLIAVEIAGGTDNVRAVNDLLSSTLPD